MASPVQLCNQALGWLGEDFITSLDDPTRAAQLCKANFDLARDAVLEAGEWSFALMQAGPLAPLAGAQAPLFGPGNLFQLPEGVLRVLRCLSGSDITSISNCYANDGAFPQSRLQWRREGMTIRAEVSALYIEYIGRVDDTEQFSPGFGQAFAARLAAELAMPITNSATMFQSMWKLYEAKIGLGLNLDGMQGRQQRIRSDQLTRAR